MYYDRNRNTSKSVSKNYIDYYIKSKIVVSVGKQISADVTVNYQVSVTRPGHAMLPALRNRSWFTKSHLNRLFTVPCCYERLMRISAKSVYLNQAYSLKTTGKASQPPPSRSWAPIIGDREQSNHISSKTLNGLNV